MIQEEALSTRYAKALFELASEQKLAAQSLSRPDSKMSAPNPVGSGAAQTESDLAHFLRTLQTEENFALFFQNPMLPLPEKKTVLNNLVAQKVLNLSPLALRFLVLLIAKGRFYLLKSIIDIYHRLINRSEHREEIVITTAHPLRVELQHLIEKIIGKNMSETIVSEIRVDPTLVAGIRVQIGNRLLDNSIRTKLDELKTQMIGSKPS